MFKVPLIGWLVQVQWPARTMPASFSSTEQIAQPPKESGLFYEATPLKMKLWNTYTHAHTYTFTHTHTSHNVVFWLFLRLGTKLLSKISQWTRLSFIFKDRERQSEKGASLILLPFPLTAQTQNTHSEDGAEVEKVKKMRPCLFTGSVRNYCGTAAVLTP